MATEQTFNSHVQSTGERVECYSTRGIQFESNNGATVIQISFHPVALDHGLGFKVEIIDRSRFYGNTTTRYLIGATMEELTSIIDRLNGSYFRQVERDGSCIERTINAWLEGVQAPVVSHELRYAGIPFEEQTSFAIRNKLSFGESEYEDDDVSIGHQLKFGKNAADF